MENPAKVFQNNLLSFCMPLVRVVLCHDLTAKENGLYGFVNWFMSRMLERRPTMEMHKYLFCQSIAHIHK